MSTLPNSKSLSLLTSTIKEAGGNVRLVGGVVRDALLNVTNKDVDLATDLLPEKIQEIFTSRGIKVAPTGIKFGTVTIVIDKQPFEVTTLRSDLESDGRHAKVEYTTDFKLDAERRDFTINAMSYDLEEDKLYDYFGGLADLESGIVRFIGNPEARIKEDYLRILRFFRFTARYGKQFHKPSLQACKKNARGMKRLSGERIKAEMDQILTGPKRLEMLDEMVKNHIWDELFGINNPDLELLEQLNSTAKQLDTELALAIIYGQLFIARRESLNMKHLLELKFTRKQAVTIIELYKLLAIKDAKELEVALVKKWLEGDEWAQYFIFCMNNLISDSILQIYKWLKSIKTRPKFPVAASDLMEQGITGIEIGKRLNKLEADWILSRFKLTKKQLI